MNRSTARTMIVEKKLCSAVPPSPLISPMRADLEKLPDGR